MAMDRFGYANYSQSARREYAQHVERTLTVRSYSMVFVKWSLLVSYEHVLWSFQIRFQVAISSLDDHIRRIFKRMSADSNYFYICNSLRERPSQIVMVLRPLLTITN